MYGELLRRPPMAEIVLTIPALPDLDLSANRRRSRVWQAQWRDTTAERINAGLLLRAAAQEANVADLPAFNEFGMRIDGWPPTPPIALCWTLYWPKGTRTRDVDTYASMLKPWHDAMVDLHWIKNDSLRFVQRVSYEGIPSSPQGPSMKLVITPVLERR